MYFFLKSRLPPIAILTITFFSWFCTEPWNFAHAGRSPVESRASDIKKSGTTLERHEEFLRVTKRTVSGLERQLAEKQDISASIERLEQCRKNNEYVSAKIRGDFAQTEAKLKAKKLPQEILVRYQQTLADFNAESNQFLKSLQRILDLYKDLQRAEQIENQARARATYAELQTVIKGLRSRLESKVKDPPHNPLDPNALPHRQPEPEKRPPRMKPEKFSELRKPVQLAFNGNLSELSLSQTVSEQPTTEDLSETPEIRFTQEIQDLAAQLEHDPVKIYEYVRNNFKFEATYGSIKGTEETLLARSGNATDQATVLIALLRVSGIPARYVMGTIGIPIEKTMNWLGVQDPATANRFLTSGGIPTIQLTQEGVVTHMELEHTWVSAFVDYVPSRGAVQREGDTWVELDPAFKQFDRTAGVDLNDVIPFDAQQLVDELLSTADVNEAEGYATGFDQALIAQRLEERRQAVEDYFQTSMPDATVGDVLGMETIVPQKLGILPASLPYRVFVRGGVISEIPDALRHKVRFQVGGLDHLENLANLAGKRITLSYAPASDQDRLTIEAYAGQPTLPAYLIRVRPVLKLAGVDAATGSAVQLGQDQQLRLAFLMPFGHQDVTRNRVQAGGYYAVGLDLQTILPDRLAQLQSEAERTRSKLEMDPEALLSTEDTVGLMLQTAIMGFWAEGDILESVFARVLNVRSFRPTPGAGIASLGLRVSAFFGVPVSAESDGSMSLDVRRSIHAVHSVANDETAFKAFVRATGLLRSQLEASALEQLFRDSDTMAVSTTAALQIANLEGIPIFRISGANLIEILPQLQVGQAIKKDIVNSVNAGMVITIPRQEITLGAWQGTGYIIENPETGASAYLLSGGIAGGLLLGIGFGNLLFLLKPLVPALIAQLIIIAVFQGYDAANILITNNLTFFQSSYVMLMTSVMAVAQMFMSYLIFAALFPPGQIGFAAFILMVNIIFSIGFFLMMNLWLNSLALLEYDMPKYRYASGRGLKVNHYFPVDESKKS